MSQLTPKKSTSDEDGFKKSSSQKLIAKPTSSAKSSSCSHEKKNCDQQSQQHQQKQSSFLSQTERCTSNQKHKCSTSGTSKCDTSAEIKEPVPSNEKTSIFDDLESSYRDDGRYQRLYLNATSTSLGASYSNLSSTLASDPGSLLKKDAQKRHSTQLACSNKPIPSPSPSLSTIDDNNNTNNNSKSCGARDSRDLANIKKSNFSKSASGSRLISRSRQNITDCQQTARDCGEKKQQHSNRRKFIEQYYVNKSLLPTETWSSFNINSPFNRLSECDAITRRLLSSPIRRRKPCEPTSNAQVTDVEQLSTRRASLGADTLTDQMFLFSSNPFQSLEISNRQGNQSKSNLGNISTSSSSSLSNNDKEIKLKQQQGRSLSVCNEETLHPSKRGSGLDHSSSNLNRAISIACATEPQTTTRRHTIIPLFGCDINSLGQFSHSSSCILPPIIDSAIDHILANGIHSLGIFRKSGVKSRILSLKKRIEENQNVKFNDIIQNNEFSIYDIADLVKMWFRELKPVPLVNRELIKLISAFLSTTFLSDSQKQSVKEEKTNYSSQDSLPISYTTSVSRLSMLRTPTVMEQQLQPHRECNDDFNLKKRIDSTTSPLQRALLFRALNFLAQISSKCHQNQMTSQNLAICLTPSLCETESDQNSMTLAQRALEYCIDNHGSLFG